MGQPILKVCNKGIKMFRDFPLAFRIWFVVCIVLGIVTLFYTLNKCGAKALLLGNGALYAAASGMCDE
jgi:hypothetical protein